jgi:hypothetical protein
LDEDGLAMLFCLWLLVFGARVKVVIRDVSPATLLWRPIRRVPLLAVSTTIASLLLVACGGDTGSGATPTSTAAAASVTAGATGEASATAAPEPTDGPPWITIDEPAFGAMVSVPFRIDGTANVFEATLTVQIFTESGRLVCQHNITGGGSGTRGPWSTIMAFPPLEPPPGNGAVPMVIHALNYSAADGSEQNVVTRDVNVSGERPVNVIDAPRCSAEVAPGAALAVAGTTRAFEGMLRVELVDGAGSLLVGQTLQATSGVGEASWSTTLMVPAYLQTGLYRLVAFDYNGRDGARENEFAVPIEVRSP